ncbi:MAG: Ribosomal protein S6--L-glutamate ligase [Microgenomates bacterium OLB23]|nr:MAG: Ribosomal protein S6--L-glutamate ligase [Microgenomates bacterium OLB23]
MNAIYRTSKSTIFPLLEKLQITKFSQKILKEVEVPTTLVLHVIKNVDQLASLDVNTLPKTFVVKPGSGVAGQGIEIIYNRDKQGNFINAQGHKISPEALKNLMANILEGAFSLNYSPDKVLIEERVKPHHKLRPFSYKGVPDIRVIVFKKVPVMAMVRWPTKDSAGRANFSQGAAGSGIDLATGITTHTIKQTSEGRIVDLEFVDGTRTRYSGFKVPYWDKILTYAVKAAKATNLGFCGVDFLIDRERGPLIVEINARPGLRIQLANQDGLKWRLEQIKRVRIKTVSHGIRLGKDLFGGEVEEEIEAIAGKKIIGLIQPVKLYHKTEKRSITIMAKVDTGATYSSIDRQIAIDLGYGEAVAQFEKLNIPKQILTREEGIAIAEKYHTQLTENNQDIINTEVIVNSNGRSYRIILGLRAKMQEKEISCTRNSYRPQ